jgi:quercetin dioxygenase-like cupin family protein
MKTMLIGLAFVCAGTAWAQDATVVTAAEQKFAALPNFPACTRGAVLHGDPSNSGGVVIIAKATAGCTIPWHWHTPNEQIGIVSGKATLQMKGEQPKTVTAGSYGYLPSHHVHQFHCVTACTLFVSADNVFDIHYVDDSGNEIRLEDAVHSAGSGKRGSTQHR